MANVSLATTVLGMDGGTDSVTGIGKVFEIEVTDDGVGEWQIGDTFTLDFGDVSTPGIIDNEVGFGSVTGLAPNYVFTFGSKGGKVYFLSGSAVFFSALLQPTVFNDPNGVGNGFVNMANAFGAAEDLIAIGVYQGRLAFFSSRTIQIWTINPDPTQWEQNQVLSNIGCIAPLSVHQIGDQDLFFLSTTGIRSLKVRDLTLNAYPDDLGSPIDPIIQDALLYSLSFKEEACGIVEPTSNRYWLFLTDKIYVFSQFPSSKVAAWSIYLPTYQDVDDEQVAFIPEKFVVFNEQVYAREKAEAVLYLYGGDDNNTYDNCRVYGETPWLDVRSPNTKKAAVGAGLVLDQNWIVKIGMDPVSGILETVYTNNIPSYDEGIIPFNSVGTHFKFSFESIAPTKAVISSLVFRYQGAEES